MDDSKVVLWLFTISTMETENSPNHSPRTLSTLMSLKIHLYDLKIN